MKFMNMKRFASTAMAGALVLSLAAPAFAATSTPAGQVTISGTKYRFDNECWALIRLSGTEPVCRAYVECETADAARRNLAALDKAIRNG